jgi:ribonuclease-3
MRASFSRSMLNNIIDILRLPFVKEKELYFSLKKIIGFYPHDISVYQQALMHKSIVHRNAKGKPMNNERLEFLGDAILDAIVGDIVYKHFPGKREGFLTNTRSKLVQRETLNKLAEEMGINHLIISSGRTSSHNSYMGGNAFEALVGAIYLDKGYNACMQFMNKRILAQLINIDKVAYKEVNFKSKLIEWGQKNRVKLDFKILQQSKDKNGSPIFKYQVIIEGIEGCAGEGFSKKESQQHASELTLKKLRNEPQFIDEVFAAKGNRTKMEEEPVETVPDTEADNSFIINSSDDVESIDKKEDKHLTPFKEEVFDDKPVFTDTPVEKVETVNNEFDLSDITHLPKEKSVEEIIAAAEASAFAEAKN